MSVMCSIFGHKWKYDMTSKRNAVIHHLAVPADGSWSEVRVCCSGQCERCGNQANFGFNDVENVWEILNDS